MRNFDVSKGLLIAGVWALALGVWISPPVKEANAASMTDYGAEGILVTSTPTTVLDLVKAQNGGVMALPSGCFSLEVPSDAAEPVFMGGTALTPGTTEANGQHSAPIRPGESRPIPAGLTKVRLVVAAGPVLVYVHLGSGC